MEKIYLNEDVYSALQKRFDYIFREFDHIYLSFSGGKDSGLLYQLLLKYMEERNIRRPIGLFHQDFEAQYAKTTEFVSRVFDSRPEFVEPFWVCLPMECKTNLSNYDLYWYPWEDDKQDIWVRPMPQRPEVINLDNNPLTYYKPKMRQEELAHKFNGWYRDHCGGGKSVGLLGMRAGESLHRYSAIVNKRHAYDDTLWITTQSKDAYTASPLYDWEPEDVWTATGKYDLDYNHLYDLMHKAGVPIREMRVASPFNEWAAQSLNLYRVIEPETWAKLVGRIQGANFGAIYGGTKATGYRQITLPAGHTWKSYTLFLLSTLPEDLREQYWSKFKTSIEFWTKTGGGLDQEVVRELEDCGYRIRHNGASRYTKGGKDRVVFEGEIPDNTDDVLSTIDIPSWKRMCVCILKNDHFCRSMGFSPPKKQNEKINAIKEKYASIIRGKVNNA